MGVAQVEKMVGFIEKKRQIARWYAEHLAELAKSCRLRLHPEAAWARNVYWMYSVILSDDCPSLDVVRARLNDRGVDSRPFFHPVHTLPPYATGQHLPVAEHLGSRGMNLPSGTGLGEADVERVARALAEALEG